MVLCKRIITRLDVKGSNVIKGIKFEGLRIVGNPSDLALRYYEAGADEILYIDSVASLYGRNNLLDIIRKAVRNVFIPVTAGGGVRSVSDAAALLAVGADKIAVNTAALQRPELIAELAEAFGSQCVVASIQARRTGPNAWEAMAEAGREPSGQDVFVWMERVQQMGAGEILLTSVDQDGTCAGPDHELQVAAAAKAKVPLVLGGGYATTKHMLDALQHPKVAGVSLGAVLHRGRLDLTTLKQDLDTGLNQLSIRGTQDPDPSPPGTDCQPLAGQRIGVIDYGIGNQQSLINALQHLGATVILSCEPDQLEECALVALPGVGSFPQAMTELSKRGLDHWLVQWTSVGRPLLGICLGMQLLFTASEEFQVTQGLSLLCGRVKLLNVNSSCEQAHVVLPHIGWNRIEPGPQQLSFANTVVKGRQYFVHSYAAYDVNPNSVLFYSEYAGHRFVAAVLDKNLCGLQFHPERSGKKGLVLLGHLCRHLIAYSKSLS